MLEKITNVVLIVVALAAVALVGGQQFNNYRRAHPAWDVKMLASTIQGLKCGPRTLVIAVSTSCHFCEESIPTYHRILASPKVTKGGIQAAFVFPDARADVDKWLVGHYLSAPSLASESVFRKAGFRRTPTILLIGENGKVSKAWIGELKPEQEKELIAALQ